MTPALIFKKKPLPLKALSRKAISNATLNGFRYFDSSESKKQQIDLLAIR